MSDILTISNSLPYFAYGSNLNARDWQAWCEKRSLNCGPLRAISRATAYNHRLVLGKHSVGRQGGVADIRPAAGHIVDGVIFHLDDAQRSALDAKEGAPDHYERFTLTVQTEDGNVIEAFSYRVTAQRARDHVTPHIDYVNVIASGLSDHGLSPLSPWEAAGAKGATPSPATGVFVYGTLLSGQSRAALLPADAVRHPASVNGRLVDCGAYPALVPGQRGIVKGEFVEIGDIGQTVELLDRIEGYSPSRDPADNLFQRRLITLEGPDGGRVRAWTYISTAAAADLPVIHSGDWQFHSGRHQAGPASFKQSSRPTVGSRAWILTELHRIERLAIARPSVLQNICELAYGKDAYWSGGEVLLISPDFHGDLRGNRDEVVMTRHAAAFSGLFVLCSLITGGDDPGWRAVYARMCDPIRAGIGTFAEQATAALQLAATFGANMACPEVEGAE